MKASELMIGDWVSIDEPDRYAGAVGQIHSLIYHNEEDNVYFYVFIQGKFGYLTKDVCSADIRPIPITHEIIKANGFELTDIGDNGPGTPRININRYERHDCKTKWYDITMWYDRNRKTWCLHGMNGIILRYVHELQHALHICGIEKEIKVEK